MGLAETSEMLLYNTEASLSYIIYANTDFSDFCYLKFIGRNT
jgi:hypothetical protein